MRVLAGRPYRPDCTTAALPATGFRLGTDPPRALSGRRSEKARISRCLRAVTPKGISGYHRTFAGSGVGMSEQPISIIIVEDERSSAGAYVQIVESEPSMRTGGRGRQQARGAGDPRQGCLRCDADRTSACPTAARIELIRQVSQRSPTSTSWSSRCFGDETARGVVDRSGRHRIHPQDSAPADVISWHPPAARRRLPVSPVVARSVLRARNRMRHDGTGACQVPSRIRCRRTRRDSATARLKGMSFIRDRRDLDLAAHSHCTHQEDLSQAGGAFARRGRLRKRQMGLLRS